MFGRTTYVIVMDHIGIAVMSAKYSSKKAALLDLPNLVSYCNRQNEWVEHTAMIKQGKGLYEFTYSQAQANLPF